MCGTARALLLDANSESPDACVRFFSVTDTRDAIAMALVFPGMKRVIVNKPTSASVKKQSLWARLGPGLITGAADDDPSGIATYSQAGAGFGYGILWTAFFTFPLMVGIQTVSARIGRVTGHGLAANIRRHYPPWLLYGIVVLLLIANTINIAPISARWGRRCNCSSADRHTGTRSRSGYYPQCCKSSYPFPAMHLY